MGISEKKKITNNRYLAKCAQLNLKPQRDEAAAIRAAAAAAGQSVQGYVLQAVRDRMRTEGQPLTVGDPSGPESVNGKNCGDEGGL